MTDLGNRYALSALRAKRAELAGEITYLKRKLAWAEDSLRHLDASLLIFDPAGDPAQIPAKRPQKRVKLFRQGQLGGMILAALRSGGRPMGTHDIVTVIMDKNGYGAVARKSLGSRVRGNLAYQEVTGKIVKAGKGKAVLWSLKT
jgi:hypothetical protein